MPRIARRHHQQRFDLYPDVETESRLIIKLAELAKQGQQRRWIVEALLEKLNQERKGHADHR